MFGSLLFIEAIMLDIMNVGRPSQDATMLEYLTRHLFL